MLQVPVPSKLECLNLLNKILTTFVECPPELESLDLQGNITNLARSMSTTEVALEGNAIPAEACPEYDSLVLQGGEIPELGSKPGWLNHFNKINEIGLHSIRGTAHAATSLFSGYQ